MNNSRYLMLMDFARLDYLARMGMMSAAFRCRWSVPAAMAQVNFYLPLKPLEKFEIGVAGAFVEPPLVLHAADFPYGSVPQQDRRDRVCEDDLLLAVWAGGAEGCGPNGSRS